MTNKQIDTLLKDIHGRAFPDRLLLTGAQVHERERELIRAFVTKHQSWQMNQSR
jgi:hypothetical protein